MRSLLRSHGSASHSPLVRPIVTTAAVRTLDNPAQTRIRRTMLALSVKQIGMLSAPSAAASLMRRLAPAERARMTGLTLGQSPFHTHDK